MAFANVLYVKINFKPKKKMLKRQMAKFNKNIYMVYDTFNTNNFLQGRNRLFKAKFLTSSKERNTVF